MQLEAKRTLQNFSSFVLKFPDIVQFSEEMACRGKVIIVAALDGTFQREVTTTFPSLRVTGYIFLFTRQQQF